GGRRMHQVRVVGHCVTSIVEEYVTKFMRERVIGSRVADGETDQAGARCLPERFSKAALVEPLYEIASNRAGRLIDREQSPLSGGRRRRIGVLIYYKIIAENCFRRRVVQRLFSALLNLDVGLAIDAVIGIGESAGGAARTLVEMGKVHGYCLLRQGVA